MWLGVARDVYVRYVDSDVYGSGTFESFLHRHLSEMGVLNLTTLSGTAKTAARKANQTFILEQRAEMRARLVQLAIEGSLYRGSAVLDGFAQSTPVQLESDEFDDDDDDVGFVE